MLNYLLFAAQIVILVVIAILLWQIWRFLKRKDLPEDEPLGEERAKYLTQRLTATSVCTIVEAALAIAQAVLRFVEGLY